MPHTLTLDAGALAFGDGTHPTTRGVVALLDAIDPQAFTPSIACDMGCGSGILALRIAQRFGCPVLAVDVERSALVATQANAEANGVGGIEVVHSDGFQHPALAARGPYALIVMNILAEPLLRMATDARDQLAPEGVLILSGILRWQEDSLLAAYETLGLERTARILLADWVTLCFQKPSA